MIQIIKYDFHLANIRSDQIINGFYMKRLPKDIERL